MLDWYCYLFVDLLFFWLVHLISSDNFYVAQRDLNPIC